MTEWGFAADALMTQAGAAAFAVLSQRWPDAARLCVCAGVGNNAGDGYVVALLAQQRGLAVTVLQLEGRVLTGSAGAAQKRAAAAGVVSVPILTEHLERAAAALAAADVVVDGLLGIGLRTAPRPLFAQLIRAMNQCPAPILALDVPSGLDADASAPFTDAIAAAVTVTFLVDKLCLRTGQGAALAGVVHLETLGLPERLLRSGSGVASAPFAATDLPDIPRNAYKHRRGHVVVVGGDEGMSGAVLLAAQAALRGGAGLVSVITRASARAGLLARCPELMVLDTSRWPAVLTLLQQATVVVCGPGLGQGAWGRTLFEAVLRLSCPRVFDADGLNLLSQCKPAPALAGAVLTPHSSEAARLLQNTSADVEQDRLSSARALAARYQATAVLKGPGTLVVGPQWQSLCPHGNQGMASAGMGDVLAGVIGAVLAQAHASDAGLDAVPALVANAVAWHSVAGDTAATRLGMRSLIATDVIAELPCQVTA